MKIDDIKIKKRIRKELGDIDILAKSIKEIGLLHLIVINEDNELICGKRRLEALRQLNINNLKENIHYRIFNIKDVLKGEFEENFCRKDFEPQECVEIWEATESSQGKKLSPDSGGGLTRKERVAKSLGVGQQWLSEVKKVVDSGDNELITKMNKGDISVHSAYTKIRLKEPIETPPLPKGQYNIIYADPPWRYEHVKTYSRAIEKEYPTMKLDDIKNMKIPSADNAILFLWATAPKLEESLSVLNAWGFMYRTCAVWDKKIIGMGYYFRNQHELLLIGIKGNFSPPKESMRVPSVYQEKRGQHSKKPEYFYELIEKMYPNGKYYEEFARRKRKNWVSRGNEL